MKKQVPAVAIAFKDKKHLLLTAGKRRDFPGWIEKRETTKQTAAREVNYWTGLEAELVFGFNAKIHFFNKLERRKEEACFPAEAVKLSWNTTGINVPGLTRQMQIINHAEKSEVQKKEHKYLQCWNLPSGLRLIASMLFTRIMRKILSTKNLQETFRI